MVHNLAAHVFEFILNVCRYVLKFVFCKSTLNYNLNLFTTVLLNLKTYDIKMA